MNSDPDVKWRWLSISLFCRKAHWHQLLEKGILPFVKANKAITSYFLEFNYLSGENIRLSLLTNHSFAEQLAKNADSYFKQFFFLAAFPQVPVRLPVNGLFMPFRPNSIRYGLYRIEPLADDPIKSQVSAILIDALKDDTIDDETILTLAFYLQLSLIKSFTSAMPGIHADLIKKNGAAPTYTVSHEMLMEIADDVFSVDRESHLPDWLNNWMNCCNAAFQGEQLEHAKITYGRIRYAISKQLALSGDMNHMLNDFMDLTIKSRIK